MSFLPRRGDSAGTHFLLAADFYISRGSGVKSAVTRNAAGEEFFFLSARSSERLCLLRAD